MPTDVSAQDAVLYRIGHPRDDAAGARVRRGESGAGVSGLSRRRPRSRKRPSARSTRTTISTRSRTARPTSAARSRTRCAATTASACDPDRNVTVTCGATEAMIASDARGDQSGRRGDRLRAVLRELRARRDHGRRHAALRHAARARICRSTRPNWRRRSASRTKAIIINTPHNPTGKVFTRAELGADRASYASATTRWRSPTRSTSTSSTTARATSRSPVCRGCAIELSRSAGCRRPTRSPDGGWHTRSRVSG